jgi:hypothetical protein
VDEFVFLDDAQFTRRDCRNLNLIMTPHGTIWHFATLTHELHVDAAFPRIRTARAEPLGAGGEGSYVEAQ